MTEYDIRIGDKSRRVPLFPEYLEGAVNGQLVGVGILEGGMRSGKVGVGLVVRCDSVHVFVELGAEAYLTIGGAIKGAMARWGQPWDGA